MTTERGFAAESLRRLEPLPLECDGVTRALSMLLARDGIQHEVHTGALVVTDVGCISYHWWIELAGWEICDARARMWLGTHERVPHGVFQPEAWQKYASKISRSPAWSPILFGILTGAPMDAYPRAARPNDG